MKQKTTIISVEKSVEKSVEINERVSLHYDFEISARNGPIAKRC